jgi:LEA14-like dessication related protein
MRLPDSARTAALTLLLLQGCATMQHRDPLTVTVAGIEPLEGEGLEMRMMVKLRVQNPNDAPVDFDGVAVEMNVQGKQFASGVSDATGSVPRFGEAVVNLPITISAFRMIRQAMGFMTSSSSGMEKLHYQMKGKLSGKGWSSTHFAVQGDFDFAGAKPTDAAPPN